MTTDDLMTQDEWRQYEKDTLRLGLRARTKEEMDAWIDSQMLSAMSKMILEGVQS